MNQILTTNTYYGIAPVQQTPPTPQFTMPEPISYEFQVVEHIHEDGKIGKVALQMKRNIHDQFGNIKIHGIWEDVPRVQIKL